MWTIPIWASLAVRILVSGVAFLLYRRLLRDEFSPARVAAACMTAVLVGLLWLVNVEQSARLVFMGLEIDRRVEAAEEIYARLEELESSATATAKSLVEIDTDAEKTAETLRSAVAHQSSIFGIETLENRAKAGSRDAYRALAGFPDTDPTLKERAQSAVFAVKSYYVGNTKIGGINLMMPDDSGHLRRTDDADVPTSYAIGHLTSQKWDVRAVSARVLRSRKHKGVPKALLDSMEQDSNLWSAYEALQAFESTTKYKSRDIFDFLGSRPRSWYDQNREDIEASLDPVPAI